MTKTSHLLDRSVAFTALLNLSPDFCQMETRRGEAVVTTLVNAWREDTESTDLYAFTRTWLEGMVCQECSRPLGQQQPWGCDLVLHGDVDLVDGEPPMVNLWDCLDCEEV